jgi:hypothetical protein
MKNEYMHHLQIINREFFLHATRFRVRKNINPTIVKTSTPPQRRQNDQLVAKMLYFIGLGLADEKDITVKGLEIVQKAERVYLEAYTAVLLVEKEKLVITPPIERTIKPSNN